METMTPDKIRETIDGFLVEEFEVPADKIHPDANLKETLGLDSLDFVDLVVEVESKFGFKVKPEDFAEIHTFSDFYAYVNEKVRGA